MSDMWPSKHLKIGYYTIFYLSSTSMGDSVFGYEKYAGILLE